MAASTGDVFPLEPTALGHRHRPLHHHPDRLQCDDLGPASPEHRTASGRGDKPRRRARRADRRATCRWSISPLRRCNRVSPVSASSHLTSCVTFSAPTPRANFCASRLKNLPQANAFTLFKPDGHLFLTTRTQSPPDLDVSDRDYYRYFVVHDDPAPFISAPGPEPRDRHADRLHRAPDQRSRSHASLVLRSARSTCSISPTSTRRSNCRPARP